MSGPVPTVPGEPDDWNSSYFRTLQWALGVPGISFADADEAAREAVEELRRSRVPATTDESE